MSSPKIGAYAAAATLVAAATFALSGRRAPEARAPAVASASAAPTAAPVGRASKAFTGPELGNSAAYVPAQCYAKTRDASGRVHDPCFVCHQDSLTPNYVDDGAVQTTLSFAAYATRNRWSQLTAPPPPAALTDDDVLARVRRSNYVDPDGRLTLPRKLATLPAAWDGNHDGAWNGFVPDCFFHADASGFDVGPDGSKTGWRAYASLPTPGLFMPTNGSAGDAWIRLPAAYREDATGTESDAVYRLNLAIVEAFIRRTNVTILDTDERPLGADLDGDGVLGHARRVAFVWPPKEGRPFHYVGKAAELDPAKDGWPVAGLFPRGTEFLHSVRYLDVVNGEAAMAARMKELRYMRKSRYMSYGQLDQAAQAEAREKFKSPDRLKSVFADPERGVTTGVGWVMQAFIEDGEGELRPQSVEETTACIGCHGGVGATTDATFTFARKGTAGAAHDGWTSATLHDLKGAEEPKRRDGQGEYAHFLARAGGGDDFRTNDEIAKTFFRKDGTLDPAMRARLARDVSLLLVPSPARALSLDRAYLGLVVAQHFEAGRDVTVGGPPDVHDAVQQGAATGVSVPELPGWKR